MQLALEKPQGPFSGRIFSLAGKKRTLYTPLFIPSFSATVREDWRSVMKAMAVGVAQNEMVLVSAFDLSEEGIKSVPGNFAGLMIDSGGYEARRLRRPWTRQSYQKARALGGADVVVAYDGDHRTKEGWKKQLDGQLASLSGVKTGTLRSILLHVELDASNASKIAKTLARHGDDFDIVGLAEKELAFSLIDRVAAVQTLRKELDAEGVIRPIHMFGADHPLSLVAYSYAGADLFDGLGWATEFFSRTSLQAADASQAPLSNEWRTVASREGANAIGALYEWNLEALSQLMAEVRKTILDNDAVAAKALLNRNTAAAPLLEVLENGR